MYCKVLGSALAAHFEALAAIYILLETVLGTVVSDVLCKEKFSWIMYRQCPYLKTSEVKPFNALPSYGKLTAIELYGRSRVLIGGLAAFGFL